MDLSLGCKKCQSFPLARPSLTSLCLSLCLSLSHLALSLSSLSLSVCLSLVCLSSLCLSLPSPDLLQSIRNGTKGFRSECEGSEERSRHQPSFPLPLRLTIELQFFQSDDLPSSGKDPLAIHLEEFTVTASDMFVSSPSPLSLSSLLTAWLRFQNLVKKLSKTKRSIKAVRHYYGDDAEVTREEDVGQIFFQILTDFAHQYMRVLKDHSEWTEHVCLLPLSPSPVSLCLFVSLSVSVSLCLPLLSFSPLSRPLILSSEKEAQRESSAQAVVLARHREARRLPIVRSRQAEVQRRYRQKLQRSTCEATHRSVESACIASRLCVSCECCSHCCCRRE
jgi:hypothetical protein